MTGFRVYKRNLIKNRLGSQPVTYQKVTATGLTRFLVRNSVEIAEVPVSYRTFKGFTNVRWRLLRGLRNAVGIFIA